MSFLLSLICASAVLRTAYSTLSDVDQACITSYSAPLANDYLIGTWYEVYKFSLFLNPIPTTVCVKTVITKANKTEIQRYEYIAGYNLDNPYSFKDNPVLVDRDNGNYQGMIVGNTQAKFHVYDPASVFYNREYYEARVYQKVNDDYMIYHRCALRGHTKWLMSKKNDTSVDELNEIIRKMGSEVSNFDSKRFCA